MKTINDNEKCPPFADRDHDEVKDEDSERWNQWWAIQNHTVVKNNTGILPSLYITQNTAYT